MHLCTDKYFYYTCFYMHVPLNIFFFFSYITLVYSDFTLRILGKNFSLLVCLTCWSPQLIVVLKEWKMHTHEGTQRTQVACMYICTFTCICVCECISIYNLHLIILSPFGEKKQKHSVILESKQPCRVQIFFPCVCHNIYYPPFFFFFSSLTCFFFCFCFLIQRELVNLIILFIQYHGSLIS